MGPKFDPTEVKVGKIITLRIFEVFTFRHVGSNFFFFFFKLCLFERPIWKDILIIFHVISMFSGLSLLFNSKAKIVNRKINCSSSTGMPYCFR